MTSDNSSLFAVPDLDVIRAEAMCAGAHDPLNLRYRIVEFDKSSGEFISVPVEDIGFPEALEKTARLIRTRSRSHFWLEPVGFIH